MGKKKQIWVFPYDKASHFRELVYKLVEGKSFGAAILIIILLNTIVLLVMTNEEIKVKWGWWFACLDFVFLAVYLMEFILKFYALRSHYFSSGANRLDFLIVLVTILDFLLPLIVQTGGVLDVAALFKLVRVARGIKAIRAVRVLRTIRFLKNLQVIFSTIMKSIRALSTIFYLMIFILLMFAVIGRGLFYQVHPEKFSDTFQAFVTLIQLMTLDDWFDIYLDVGEPPDDNMKYALLVYMVIFIILQYFIFLNLLVAVIVDNFQRTLAASEKKSSGSRRRTTVFLSDLDSDDDDYMDETITETTESSEGGDSESTIPLLSIEDYYPEETLPDPRDRQLLHNFFNNLAMLEYNQHQSHVQQKLLDDLVDITVTVTDVPEDLI